MLAQFSLANDQMRDWTLTSGEKKQAKILTFDESSRTVTLRLSDQSEIKVTEDELSTIDPDSKRLQEAGSVISVHAFEGGHQLAPPSVQTKAMRWLIEDRP